MHYCYYYSPLLTGIALLACVVWLALGQAGDDGNHWVTTWASAPQLTEPFNLPPPPFNEAGRVFFNSTVRQTVQVCSETDSIRLRVSNAFGGSDLPITAATIAAPASEQKNDGGSGTAAIELDTLQRLTFSGSQSFTVPSGALVVSDPVEFQVKRESILTISLYLEEGQTTNNVTSHPNSWTTSWFSVGNHVEAANMTDPSTQSAAHWYFISAIDAWTPQDSGAFVIVGDSITDGSGSEGNENNRWTDVLLRNMESNPSTSEITVVNQATYGNRILRDGVGPDALSRLDRDVLAQSAVKYVMIFEGVNDIGMADNTTEAQEAVGDRLITAFQQIALRVHTQGIPIFASTITPFMAPPDVVSDYSGPTREETRQRVNAWIRETDAFDAVVDLDKVVADPDNPSQMQPEFQAGDYLHFSVAGHQAVADTFPLMLLGQFAGRVDGYR